LFVTQILSLKYLSSFNSRGNDAGKHASKR
jgi:hypothetical protein